MLKIFLPHWVWSALVGDKTESSDCESLPPRTKSYGKDEVYDELLVRFYKLRTRCDAYRIILRIILALLALKIYFTLTGG